VVGISWYESRAYSLWLSDAAKMTVQLPTEAQWEVAASMARSRNDPGSSVRARPDVNNQECHLFRPSPVGVFSTYSTRFSIDDIVGNVLEYTSTITWETFPYPYQAQDGRENPFALASAYRIARGGCWNLDKTDCRNECRYELAPTTRSGNVGLRLSAAHSGAFSEWKGTAE